MSLFPVTTQLRLILLALPLLFISAAYAGEKADKAPYPGTVTVASPHEFVVLVQRLEQAISDHDMGLVARASASGGAAKRGVTIPGNEVLMVFRNDYAVRMLAASIPAGIEAPLRLYVTENADGTASVTYRLPSAVFAPYGNAELDAMAEELDPIIKEIVTDAARE